jgi:hypothetical protein
MDTLYGKSLLQVWIQDDDHPEVVRRPITITNVSCEISGNYKYCTTTTQD